MGRESMSVSICPQRASSSSRFAVCRSPEGGAKALGRSMIDPGCQALLLPPWARITNTPTIAMTAETISGVQLAVLTAMSIPSRLNDSESPMACMPKMMQPKMPMMTRIVPKIFMVAQCVVESGLSPRTTPFLSVWGCVIGSQTIRSEKYFLKMLSGNQTAGTSPHPCGVGGAPGCQEVPAQALSLLGFQRDFKSPIRSASKKMNGALCMARSAQSMAPMPTAPPSSQRHLPTRWGSGKKGANPRVSDARMARVYSPLRDVRGEWVMRAKLAPCCQAVGD